MEDYDPTAFQRTVGEALAAWALFFALIAAILIGSLIISGAEFIEPNVPQTAEKDSRLDVHERSCTQDHFFDLSST